jgi:hypothetical protein
MMIILVAIWSWVDLLMIKFIFDDKRNVLNQLLIKCDCATVGLKFHYYDLFGI